MLENMNLNEEKKEPLRLLPLRWRICSLQPCKLISFKLKNSSQLKGMEGFVGNINISHKY